MSGAQQSHSERQVHRRLHQGRDRQQQGQGGLEVRGDGSGPTVLVDILSCRHW